MAFLDNDAAGGVELTTVDTAPVYDEADKKFGTTCASFGGAGQFRSTQQVPWSFPTNFTLHWWMKHPGALHNVKLFAHGTEGAGANWDMFFRNYSGPTILEFRKAGGAGIVYWTGTLATSTWYHVAVVKNGTTWRLFVNGDLKATRTDSWVPDSSSFYINMGNLWHIDDFYYNGRLDSVCWENEALWTVNFTPPTSPPIVTANTRMLFQFDEDFYQIQGVLSDEARVTVIDYDSRIVEYDGVKSAGAYAVDATDNSVKLVVAERISDGSALAYGQVVPALI